MKHSSNQGCVSDFVVDRTGSEYGPPVAVYIKKHGYLRILVGFKGKSGMTSRKKKFGSNNGVWKFFTSVKLTVFVLLILAATSIIGTLIPQNASQGFYLQKYGEVFFSLFKGLNIIDMYHSWWFLTLLGLLAVNIIVCSIDRLQTTWKIIFPDKVSFNLERFNRMPAALRFDCEKEADVLEKACHKLLETSVGPVSVKKNDGGTALFAEQRRWTRLGVYVVHLSILFMLAGAVIGSMLGFKGFVNITEGETTDFIEARKGEHKHIPLGFSVRCNDFSVSFYDTGQPEEFKSSLTVIEGGKEVLTRDIVVNDPLRYRGISFYQSSYGTASAKNVRLKYTSKDSGMVYEKTLSFKEPLILPESGGTLILDRFANGYQFRGHNLGEGFVGRIVPEKGSETEIFISVRFPTFDKMRQGKFAFEVDGFDKKYYTGLQVNKDPGVWYVYFGFILMIAGCWITFFMSHQSSCIYITGGDGRQSRIMVSGFAHRNPQGMKLKIEKLAEKIKDI
ncbi:cytochrome c biogenesis protein [Desulfocicer vacuolatum DSM 3385]|uniref:Cytochrome c biogenesis protein n=1 Tax=Desulfocicer vacuolatum DSM 3385 TaxID=1121400 RepID=A0A1W2E1F9_9BACT|nr:cytochrome c biogenesis protein ResB [Desulfocicer vacuolatum]SMD03579.1 cytochrome c biogenesis protein [Desulfocicer vacuolatum DSM 3385]